MQNQKAAVESGQWLLYRYDPRPRGARRESAATGFAAPQIKVRIISNSENRFKMLTKSKPDRRERNFRAGAGRTRPRAAELYQYLAAPNEISNPTDDQTPWISPPIISA